MSEWTRIREGPCATADTRTNLTTLGSNATPGTLTVPSTAKRIKRLWVAVGQETPTLAAHGGVVFVRLWGEAIRGEQTFMIAGVSSTGTTAGETSNEGTNDCIPIDVPIVKPGGTLSIAGEMAGVEATDQSIVCEVLGE